MINDAIRSLHSDFLVFLILGNILYRWEHSLLGHAGPTKRFHDHAHTDATRQFYMQAKPSQHTAAGFMLAPPVLFIKILKFSFCNFWDALLAEYLVSFFG